MSHARTPARTQLSLIIPAWNEAAGIACAIGEALEALTTLDYEFEILVVDDGSTDRTAREVQQIATLRPGVRLIRHERNRGYGAALATGFQAAQYPLVAFTDADNQFHLEDLERLVPLTRRYPIVAGRRADRQDSRRRRLMSRGYNTIVRFLLNTRVRDCDCALKVFRREVLAHLLPRSRGFFVNAEMLCRANRLGVAITEVDVRHRPRIHGDSKVSLWDVPRTLATLLPFWCRQVLLTPRPAPLRLMPAREVPVKSPAPLAISVRVG